MRFFKAVLVGLALALLVGMFLNPAQADQWNKKTILTFSQRSIPEPVRGILVAAVPTLPAGRVAISRRRPTNSLTPANPH